MTTLTAEQRLAEVLAHELGETEATIQEAQAVLASYEGCGLTPEDFAIDILEGDKQGLLRILTGLNKGNTYAQAIGEMMDLHPTLLSLIWRRLG